MSTKEINEVFNAQLASFNEATASDIIFDLGAPSKNVRAAGVAKRSYKLYGNKLLKKIKKHGFDKDELKNLPKAVSSPIAVFKNKEREGNYSILTELATENGNFLVTIDLGEDADVDFNIVSSVFGKGKEKIVDWINKGYLRYVDKEKAQEYLLHKSAPIAATSAYSALISATKIVKSFRNPSILGQNISFS